jgi:hypothetical protein
MALTIIAVGITWILWRGGWGKGTELARIDKIGLIAVLVIIIMGVTMTSLGLAINRRSVKGSAFGASFEATGGDDSTISNAAGRCRGRWCRRWSSRHARDRRSQARSASFHPEAARMIQLRFAQPRAYSRRRGDALSPTARPGRRSRTTRRIITMPPSATATRATRWPIAARTSSATISSPRGWEATA